MNWVKIIVSKIPPICWFLVCICIAIFYSIVWPSEANSGEAGSLRYFILRWFHSLAWLFLALASLFATFDKVRFKKVSHLLALSALPIYAAFILTYAVK